MSEQLENIICTPSMSSAEDSPAKTSLSQDSATVLGGGRSGLWSEMARIIRELRPRFVLVENVAALLAPTRRAGWVEPAAIARVLGDLAEIGYDAEWDVISASNLGAPHLRERVWVIAYDRQERVEGFFQQEIPQVEAFSWCKNVRRVEDLRGRPDIPEPLFRGASDGISCWVDRIGAIGNAVVPQIPELIARRLMELYYSSSTPSSSSAVASSIASTTSSAG